MIASADFSIDNVTQVLDDAVIDFTVTEDGGVYVTGLNFNFWIRHDEKGQLLHFTTFWDLRPEVSELEALQCANALNYEYIMAQFYTGADGRQMRAAYAFPIHEGFYPRFFLRAARLFAGVFRSAVLDPIAQPLLEPWPEQDAPSEPSTGEGAALN